MRKLVVGIGGTNRPGSSSEGALRYSLGLVEHMGAQTLLLPGRVLAGLPMYDAAAGLSHPDAAHLVGAVREADGLVIASPGYHGSIAGVVKNALDYIEELRTDDRPYLDGRAVGCIATATGWQAIGTTLQALRSVVHALRGWPTPLGVGINSSVEVFGPDGDCVDQAVRMQLEVMTEQVFSFGDLAVRTPPASRS